MVTLGYLGIASLGGWLAWGEVQGERFKAKSTRPIVLGPGGILAPAIPDGRRMVKLTYDGITELKVDDGTGAPWLYITHQEGKLAIASEAMESNAAFQRLLTSLQLRVTLARGAMQSLR